jgi:hypothetical protein
MAGGYKIGLECKLYYDPTGAGAGTYAVVPITRVPNLGLTSDEAVIEDRSVVWKRYKRGMLDAPLELEISRKVGDTIYEVFRDAYLDGSVIGIAIASGTMTTVGEEVFEADFVVTSFPINEPLSEVQSVPMTLRLAADTSFTPTFSTVTV